MDNIDQIDFVSNVIQAVNNVMEETKILAQNARKDIICIIPHVQLCVRTIFLVMILLVYANLVEKIARFVSATHLKTVFYGKTDSYKIKIAERHIISSYKDKSH